MSVVVDKILGQPLLHNHKEFLKLDQTIPQTVKNGMPSFKGGIKVPSSSLYYYYASLSPVVYSGTNYYITGDAAVIFYLSSTLELQLVTDTGIAAPLLIGGLTYNQPPIYMYLVTSPALGNAHVTCFSDLNQTDFLAYIRTLTEDPTATIDYYETAFTYSVTGYTNVTTKPVCPPSTTTTWYNPIKITRSLGGFTVEEGTADINHTSNYTNTNSNSIFKTKGQIKAGNGNLLNLVNCPITSNPIMNTDTGNLQFSMTFVPELSATGTATNISNKTVEIAGVYGTTAIEGSYAHYGGEVLGMWAAIQNAIDTDGNVTVDNAFSFRGGITYSSESGQEIYIKNLSCFQTEFTNFSGGSSKHDVIKHFEAKFLDDNVNSCTDNFAFYAADNSSKATNSWGLYSLEPSNYSKKLYIGATPTAPTEDLEVQANAKMAKCLTPEVKTDTATPTDLHIVTGSQKTLVLDTPVYNDIYTGVASAKLPAANFPDWATFTTNTNAYTFKINDYADLSTIEVLHDYKEGADLEVHLHLATNGLNNATERKVKYMVYYTWANPDNGTNTFTAEDSLTAELTIPANQADKSAFYLSLGTITGTNMKTGAQIKFRIKRIAGTGTEPANDPFLGMVGIHYQTDTMGSRQIGAK